MVAYDRDADLRLIETFKHSRSRWFCYKLSLADVGEGASERNLTAYVKATLAPPRMARASRAWDAAQAA